MDYKIYIAKKINEYINLSIEEIESMLEVPVKYENGDYSLPCFHLSKILKKPPNLIAKELKKQIKLHNVKIKIDILSYFSTK